MAQGGTNVAKETGGNLAGAATSLAILDDWDESDRAKTNIIVGQAGITAGAGAVAANTPRVTHASDDPVVTALQIIDNIVSGNEAQVDIVAALPAGDNNIGNVDIVSGTITTIGTLDTITNVVHVDDNGGSLSVDDGGGSLTVDGTVAATQSGTWDIGTLATITNVVHVDDNGGSLSVDDGAGSLTVDGTVAATQSGTWNVGTVTTVSSITAGSITPVASASGTGTSAYRNTNLSSTDQAVKASAGRLYGIHVYNPNATVVYLHLYDASTASVGTSTTPTRSYAVPARGWVDQQLTIPQSYATAITVAASDVAADASDAPATGLVVQLEYL